MLVNATAVANCNSYNHKSIFLKTWFEVDPLGAGVGKGYLMIKD